MSQHGDAEGAYLGEQGAEGETFCRGVQLTDGDGVAVRHGVPGLVTPAARNPREGAGGRHQTHTGAAFFDLGDDVGRVRAGAYAERGESDSPITNTAT